MEKKEKKGLISFSELNKYFIIPFISPVVNAIHSLLFNYTFSEKKIPSKNKGFLILNYSFLCVLLGNGIPFLISLCLQTKHKEKNVLSIKFKSNKASTELINNNELEQKKGKLFFLIILLALLYASTSTYNCFDLNNKYYALNERFFIILFVFLWSKVILKIQIFHHHYFSLLIYFIGLYFLQYLYLKYLQKMIFFIIYFH